RKLTDIFSVESEIAKGIAESLQAKLSGREQQELAAKPTNNLEAYDAYLRGVAFEARYYSSFFLGDLEKNALSFFERAVQLDPNFALAWARLSPWAPVVPRFGAMPRNELWTTRRNWSRTHPKPCLHWVITNTGGCVITGLLKPRSVASARCYRAVARYHMPSA